ncbi:MAG: nitrilase-related carbon-nitrogen hydrolase [Acidimicrobiales bacterium]
MSQRGNILRTAILVIVAILCGFLSGWILTWSLPPYGIWPLVFIGFIPMIIAQYRLVPRNWCWIPMAAMVLTYVHFAYAFQEFSAGNALLLTVVAAVIVAPFAVLDRRISERTNFRWFVLQMPVVWIGLDSLRQIFPITGTMLNLSYSLTHEPKLIEPVSVFGLYGLELMIVAINYALGLVVLHFVTYQKATDLVPSRRVVVSLVAVVLVFTVAWGIAGSTLYNSVQSSSGPTVRVAIVQPGSAYAADVDNTAGFLPAAQEAKFEAQLSAMTIQAADHGAQLVVWPEEYLQFNPASAPASDAAWLQGLLKQTHVYLATGFVYPFNKLTWESWPNYDYENAADLIAPDGAVLGTYIKQHQAPYDDDLFKVGTSSDSYQTRIGKIGMIICMDIVFQDTVRDTTLSGANIVAIPSWQGSGLGRGQWYDVAVFDAVENRVPVALDDQAWDSVIVKADGQIVAADNTPAVAGRTDLLIGNVQLGPRNSPFLTFGNWVGEMGTFALAIIIFCGLNCIWLDRKESKRRGKYVPTNSI